MFHLYIVLLFADFELEKERVLLDEQGLRIAENQENSQKNRRKLAESTRGNTTCFPYLTAILMMSFRNRHHWIRIRYKLAVWSRCKDVNFSFSFWNIFRKKELYVMVNGDGILIACYTSF